MRRYYMHTRNNGIFYAELVDPATGRKLTARSTGEKDRDQALLKVALWLQAGIPTGRTRKPRPVEVAAGLENILRAIRKSDINSDEALRIVHALRDRELISMPVVKAGKGTVLFPAFLENFWDYEASPYIREKLAHGQSIGKRHCYDSRSRCSGYWEPVFTGRTLDSITRQDLKDFSLSLADKGLAPATINKTMLVGTTALSWAAKEGMIPQDPTAGLVNFSGQTKKRGVLTPLEVQAIFAKPWKDKRAYVASLLSCTTGMRSGEVLALRREDIEERCLNVRHSYSAYDGLKSPKNGEARRVPLLPQVRALLLELAEENPHGPDGFIFYGILQDKPLDGKVILKGLNSALAELGIDYKARNICFHSWRHFYAARLHDSMTAEQVMRVTGHKSEAIFEIYQDHLEDENLEKMGAAAAEVFGNILNFADRKGA